MTIVRVGSNQKYAEGWDQVFGKGKAKKKPAKAAKKKSAAKKSKR